MKSVSDLNQSSYATQIGVSVTSGFRAGMVAAVISHPADTLLTLMNKGSGESDESLMKKMGNIVRSTGMYSTGFAQRHYSRESFTWDS